MIIKKGTKLQVTDNRKGKYIGIASEDFDTEDEWYNVVVVDEQGLVVGLTTEWIAGEKIPCRKGIAFIEPLPK